MSRDGFEYVSAGTVSLARRVLARQWLFGGMVAVDPRDPAAQLDAHVTAALKRAENRRLRRLDARCFE